MFKHVCILKAFVISNRAYVPFELWIDYNHKFLGIWQMIKVFNLLIYYFHKIWFQSVISQH